MLLSAKLRALSQAGLLTKMMAVIRHQAAAALIFI
jgi:hypothetical protein